MTDSRSERSAAWSFAFGPFVLVPKRQLLLENGRPVKIGARAIDILTVLVGRAGSLVSKRELLALVWPNTVVEEGNLKVNMAALRRILHEAPDMPAYIATVAGRGYRFIAPVEALDPAAPSLEPEYVVPPGSALPWPTTRIVGREEAIRNIREALSESHLVSIVGSGGIGKTTVAVAVAQSIEDAGDSSVAFVDLSRVASQDFVLAALSTSLGISSQGGDTLSAIVAILAKRKIVLLFDTCEHVQPAVARICTVLLAKTVEVRILATSRHVLGAHGERVEWLGPLDIPSPDRSLTAEDVLRFSAPRLLLDRVTERTCYQLQDADAGAFAEICRRLDGAPLAIELVSSRFAGRSASVVLAELDERFRTLRRDGPGGPFRQQTLLATLEWSYSLLTKAERIVLRAIAIFAGTFDMDAAVSVVAHTEMSMADVFGAISELRAKSMLSVAPDSDPPRFRLLDTTRAFAVDLLNSQGELQAVSASHARLLHAILTRPGHGHLALPLRESHAIFDNVADDLRKAIDWALHRSGDAMLGIRLVVAGLPLWSELSLNEELVRNCERALAEFERIACPDAALKLQLVVALASASTYCGADPEKTVALFMRAVRLAQEAGDASAECQALSALIAYSVLNGNHGAWNSLPLLEDAAKRSNDRAAILEYEQLCSHQEALSGEWQAYHSRIKRLWSEIHDQAEGPVPRFQIHLKSKLEVHLAASYWFLGRPGEAILIADRAAQNAIDTSHGLTLVHCLSRGILFIMFLCREVEKARNYAQLFKRAVYRHSMSTWIPLARLHDEVACAYAGVYRSPDRLRSVRDELKLSTFPQQHQAYFASVADAMMTIGAAEDAAKTLDYVFDQGPARWVLPELLRVRARTERSFGRESDAAVTLREAMRVAEETEGLGWKLLVAHDMAKLLFDQGELLEARNTLAPIYEQFTDGLETGALRDSRKLLMQLS
jgi:predicted ATPase/DNA-binding winged helix-turn-helix (wHTH) protein